MSVINSGLGWKCDSDYFVAEADAELAIVSTDTAYKALQGAAITAQITNGNSTQLFLISTVENNAKLKMNSSLRTVYSVSVGGETWYISMSYMSGSVTSDYPLITASKGETLNDTTPENLAKIISEIAEAADVVFAKKIPTVDYIHQYVEGVEDETVNRVNAIKNMITPVFDTQTIYAVGDYCIYNNGLYKCTTAHTGAWSANDFTSVNVMDEVKNASGGGGISDIIHLQNIISIDTLVEPVKVTGSMYDYYHFYVQHSNFNWEAQNSYNVYYYITRGQTYSNTVPDKSTFFSIVSITASKMNYSMLCSYNNIGVSSGGNGLVTALNINYPNQSTTFVDIEMKASSLNTNWRIQATKIVWV